MITAIAMSTENVWCWQGWTFRLHALPDNAEAITLAHLLTLMKLHAKVRVVAFSDPAEIDGRGFVIGTTSGAGGVRIQTWWWTSDNHLHRDAAFVRPGNRAFERMAPWDVASTVEAAIIVSEIAEALHRRTN